METEDNIVDSLQQIEELRSATHLTMNLVRYDDEKSENSDNDDDNGFESLIEDADELDEDEEMDDIENLALDNNTALGTGK